MSNIIWLLFDHSLTFIGGFFISIWLARYLGPENYGIFAYALALFAIASNFSQLGLNGIAVKEIVNSSNLDQSISTVVTLKFLGAILSCFALIGYAIYDADSEIKLTMSVLIGLTVILKPFSVIENYFDSLVLSKYKVISRKSGYIIKSILIVFLIILEWPFWTLAIFIIIEQIIPVLMLIWFFLKQRGGFIFKYSQSKAKELLEQSWPLIVSGLGGVLYLTMDQIMVVSMSGDEQGGIYAAAVRYTSIFFFLQSILMTTFFPSLLKKKSKGNINYHKAITELSGLLLYVSLGVIFGTHLLIAPFIEFAYGVEYLDSIPVIKYHIWSLPLVYLGAVLSKWLIIENLTKFSLLRHSLGLLVNLTLNLWLIPIYGPSGAAIASVAALFFSVIVVLAFHSRLRILFHLFVRSVFYPKILFNKI